MSLFIIYYCILMTVQIAILFTSAGFELLSTVNKIVDIYRIYRVYGSKGIEM